MKDFLFIYRDSSSNTQPSPEEMQASMSRWMNWLGSIAAQNKLVDRGHPLMPDGKVRKQGNVITDGPYTEIKETVGGFSIVRAESLEEATEIANGCPSLDRGGSVEIREIVAM